MRLVGRDIEIIQFLREQGVATSKQLQDRFFVSRDALRTRLSTLVRWGFIESLRLIDHKDIVPSKMVPLFESMGVKPESRSKYHIYRLGPELRARGDRGIQMTATAGFWQHQIGLSDVRTQIEPLLASEFPDGIFLFDSDLRRETARIGKVDLIPDIVWRYQDFELAIEFERNFKDEMTYFKRFADFERSSYKKIIYFVTNEDLLYRLAKIGKSFPKLGFAVFGDSRIFNHFRGVESFRQFVFPNSDRRKLWKHKWESELELIKKERATLDEASHEGHTPEDTSS